MEPWGIALRKGLSAVGNSLALVLSAFAYRCNGLVLTWNSSRQQRVRTEMRKLLSVVVALAFGILSPYAACQLLPIFHYGDAEMRAAVEGIWRLDAASRTVLFRIEQATEAERNASSGWLPKAAACSDDRRTLVRAADACVDLIKTDMPLVITALSGAVGRSSGTFNVHGYRFRSGEVRLEVAGLVVYATLDPRGRVSAGRAFDELSQPLPVTLVRTGS